MQYASRVRNPLQSNPMDAPLATHPRPHLALSTIVGILTTIIAISAYLVAANFWNFWPYGAQDGVPCTMEAKICPDGTGVGRTGPNCEFAACSGEIIYTNDQYGFSVALPASWQEYTIVSGTREIRDVSTGSVVTTAPTISIRHPLWTETKPRQDIPIDIYTLPQWDKITGEQYSVGAAPIPPSELARNSRYVFALPARYNYAFPEGFEEVERILTAKPVSAFERFKWQTVQSGISGIVLTGPTCPVVRVNDPSCNDKPYQGNFIIKDVAGMREIARFSTDSNGRFLVYLAPGEYSIEPAQPIGLGAQAQLVEVSAGIMSDITLTFDTGIR